MEFLSNIMVDALKFFAFFGGYGWGIVWLTIAVNLALYPLTFSSVKSMGAMQRLQPKLQELQKKHADKQELQKATMELYKAEKINPLGGCLPVLLKIPFFLALFWAFQSTAFLQIASDPANNTGFLWITGNVSGQAFHSEELVDKLDGAKVIIYDEEGSRKFNDARYVWDVAMEVGDKRVKDILWTANEKKPEDVKRVEEEFAPVVKLDDAETVNTILAWKDTNSLAKPDRVKTPFGAISILALLVGLTTFLMQKTMPTAGAAGQQMQMMTWFMPLFLVFICWNFPAGVQIYWLVSNLVGAAQQYLIMKGLDRKRNKKEAKNEKCKDEGKEC
ncbi:MAG: membrane protein insertase YidC [Candidatus Saganbacteria bacterium]|nr:membrane protein insertase YidC [Candidatus Saganbacteria bacterium]